MDLLLFETLIDRYPGGYREDTVVEKSRNARVSPFPLFLSFAKKVVVAGSILAGYVILVFRLTRRRVFQKPGL